MRVIRDSVCEVLRCYFSCLLFSRSSACMFVQWLLDPLFFICDCYFLGHILEWYWPFVMSSSVGVVVLALRIFG